MEAMRGKYIGLFLMLFAGCLIGQTSDDSAIAVQLKLLKNRMISLQKELDEEMSKRDIRVNGVTPQALEEMNDRQDSICLDIKSRLVVVQLEIEELKKWNLIQAISSQQDKQ